MNKIKNCEQKVKLLKFLLQDEYGVQKSSDMKGETLESLTYLVHMYDEMGLTHDGADQFLNRVHGVDC